MHRRNIASIFSFGHFEVALHLVYKKVQVRYVYAMEEDQCTTECYQSVRLLDYDSDL